MKGRRSAWDVELKLFDPRRAEEGSRIGAPADVDSVEFGWFVGDAVEEGWPCSSFCRAAAFPPFRRRPRRRRVAAACSGRHCPWCRRLVRGRCIGVGTSSCGSSSVKTKMVASPSSRWPVVATDLEDFRLLARVRLLGALKAAACLRSVKMAMAAVLPEDLVVFSFLFRVVCFCVIS